MSTITKTITNIFTDIGSLFSSGIDVDGIEEEKLSDDLAAVLRSLSTKEKDVEQPINAVNNSSKKGGFGKRINPIENKKTEKAMRAMHQKVKKTVGDKERE